VGAFFYYISCYDYENAIEPGDNRDVRSPVGIDLKGRSMPVEHQWSNRIEAIYDRYLAALLAGSKGECSLIVTDLLDGCIPVRTLYRELLQKAMYQVGELWEQNRISVAREHLATSVTEFIMTLVYPRLFAVEHCGRKAVVACVANEYHQLGARMVADIFELNGWDGYFLGANTPVRELLSLLEEKRPDFLALSLSVSSNLPSLLDTLKIVRESFTDLDILVGGQAFRWGGTGSVASFRNVTCLESIDDLEELLRRSC
jgi:methanogenic corrinoid protein MtbC1